MRSKRKSYHILMYPFIYSISCFLLFTLSDVNAQSTSGTNETPGTENAEQVQGTDQDIPTDEAIVAHGRELFGQHCTVCHQIGQQIIGPALASVHQRRPLTWLLTFIKNSQEVIANQEDEYAQQLYEQYNKVVMPPFEFLSNDDIIAILAYIKSESEPGTGREYGGVNSAESAQAPNSDQGSDSEAEAYSQKGDNEGEFDETSSGLSGALTFGVIIGMIILIGIIFAVAKRSGSTKKR